MKTHKQNKLWAVVSVLVMVGMAASLLAFTPAQRAVASRNALDELPKDALVIPGELVVAFPEGNSAQSTRAQAAALAGQVGADVVQTYAHFALLSVDPATDTAALAERISAPASGVYAQPNYVYRIPNPIVSAALPATNTRQDVTAEGETGMSWDGLASMRHLVKKGSRVQSVPVVPNDGKPAWAWDMIQADYVWSDKSSSPLVCLPDTGVDYRHPDLKGKIIKGYDFFNMDKEPEDSNGHGTHLAGIITANANNGEDTAVGVSNSKVLAVKVAGSEGWGSTFTLAAGVYYCANNKSVKIINLSMGSHHPDGLVYNSLDYAINTKGKLVVAAAGNDGRSAIMDWAHDHDGWRDHPAFYPAGWADKNVGWDDGGWVTYNPDGDENEADNVIYQGLLSVGATRSEYGHEDGSKFWLWLDTNEDDVMDDGENYNYDYHCLTWFSNYGRWVDMTAPGQSIYSTTPVSYPFAMNYYDRLDSGYGWLDGTSQAAAFVTGSAARVWSVNRTMVNADIKKRLIETGHDPSDLYGSNNLAVDETVTVPWKADQDGDKFDWYPEDEGNPNDDYGSMPYCYPTANEDGDGNDNPFGPAEDMGGTRVLNVAAAMNRFRIYANVRDAFTGMPLDGATVQLKLGKTVVDKTVVKSDRDEFFSVVLNNIPYQEGGVYQYQVSKKGYTSGYQTYSQFTIDPAYPEDNPQPGWGLTDPSSNVSVPQANANLHAVLDWGAYPWEDETRGTNLDLYLWLPPAWPTFDADANGAVINRGRLFHDYQPAYDVYPDSNPMGGWDGNAGEGNLLDSAMYTDKQDVPPYAQHVFERWEDERASTETITIRTNKGLPWYAGDYTFMVADYSSQYDDGGFGDEPDRLDIDGDRFVSPVVRLWLKGKIVATVALDRNATDPGCYDDGMDADFWKAVTVNGKTYTVSQECGTAELPGEGNSIFPY